MKPAVLKVNGKPLNLNPDPPALLAIKTFLASGPDDEVFTADELGRKTNLNVSTVRHFALDPRLTEFTEVRARTRYFGSKKALALLREQVQA